MRKPRAGFLRRVFRLVLLLLFTFWGFSLILLQNLFIRDSRKWTKATSIATHKWGKRCCWALGIHTVHHNVPPKSLVKYFTPNHIGYCDIIAIATLCPVLFVTRAELYAWPVVGVILRRIALPAISRSDQRVLKEVNQALINSLQNGVSVCTFLEGTSTGGDKVLKFRSPLMESAVTSEAYAVPLCVKWTSRSGIDISEEVAYWKDHEFRPHFWNFLGLVGLQVELTCGEPLPTANRERHDLTRELHHWVADALESTSAA
ncbi:MAG: lysophospholipid acyltransferase family protein [Sumerlaeia bacterium]